MKQFFIGVVVASLVWGGVLVAEVSGVIDLGGEPDEVVAVADAGVAAEAPEPEEPAKKKRGKRGKRRKGDRQTPGWETGNGTVGDDIEGASPRDVDMGAGGEQQLSSAQIDRGIDQVFNGIQRCLVLVPPGAPATGKVVIGMKIAPSGKVTGVNLSGPNDLVKGDSGACIRRAVKSIDFPSFDGPEMTARYPITFE